MEPTTDDLARMDHTARAGALIEELNHRIDSQTFPDGVTHAEDRRRFFDAATSLAQTHALVGIGEQLKALNTVVGPLAEHLAHPQSYTGEHPDDRLTQVASDSYRDGWADGQRYGAKLQQEKIDKIKSLAEAAMIHTPSSTLGSILYFIDGRTQADDGKPIPFVVVDDEEPETDDLAEAAEDGRATP